ncbi:MAG: amino acid adenylation domain-containing protein, partial [Bacteroidota bacterium]
MNPKQFIDRLRRSKLSLDIRNDQLVLKGLDGKLSPKQIKAVLQEEQDIPHYIKQHREVLKQHLLALDPQLLKRNRAKEISALYPLSPLQEGMLFHSMYNEVSGAYINQFTCDLEAIHLTHFEAAWNHLLQQYSILRTAFFYEEFDLPLQGVFKKASIPFYVHDLRQRSAADQKAQIQIFLRKDREAGFDMSRPPLMRINLFQISEQQYQLVWTHHHIISDGWSTPIMIGTLMQRYQQLCNGLTPTLKKEDRYQDYIKYITAKDQKTQQDFWENYLSAVEHPVVLPFVKTQALRNKAGAEIRKKSLLLDTAFNRQLQALAHQYQITSSTIVQGVWAYLLYRYTHASEIVFGVTVSGRPPELADSDQRVGLYINTIPLHTKIEEEQSIVAWLQRLQQRHTQAREFQYTSLRAIQQWKGSKEELFDSIVVFENYPVGEEIAAGQGPMISNTAVDERTNYLLTITIGQSDTLDVHFHYDHTQLEEEDIDRMLGHFEQVLGQMIQSPEQPISHLSILNPQEREQLLHQFNDTQVDYSPTANILNVFAQQVKQSPKAPAITFKEKTLTYEELDRQSNQVAHYLQPLKVQKGEIIAICLDRSLEMLIGLLGILKAGAAYTPIDPEYPAERKAYMLADTAARFLLCDTAQEKPLTATLDLTSITLINLEDPTLQAAKAQAIELDTSPTDPAYVIYTSGSTGRPKGVINQHAALYNRLQWAQDYYQLDKEDVIAQKTTFCFDVSVWELFWPIMVGARIVFAEPEGHKDPNYLKALIEKEKITTIHFVPSMLNAFLLDKAAKTCPSLKRVICSGEALRKTTVEQFKRNFPQTKLYNLYGPTEAAIDVSYWAIPPAVESLDTIPIGEPLANTQLQVLDQQDRLVPIGVVGELCIGGVQVARGYLNKPELTHDRFVSDPFQADQLLYRTGDLVKRRADGLLEYLGRKDHQVKIRGLRIELGEIEENLNQYEPVSEAVVSVHEDERGNLRLVAYVVAQDFDRQAAEAFMHRHLPTYMVPRIWVQMAAIPLNKNGKADRKALPPPNQATQQK